MNILLLELRSLFEKASKPKKYHQDYVDLETWRSVINHLLKVMKIGSLVQADNTFSESDADKIYQYLDLLPSLDGISQKQLVSLTDFLSEVFDLLLTNHDAKKVIDDLKGILDLIDNFEKNIPPPDKQVGVDNPDLPSDTPQTTEAPADQTSASEIPPAEEET